MPFKTATRVLCSASFYVSLFVAGAVVVSWLISYWEPIHYEYNTPNARNPVVYGAFFAFEIDRGTVSVEWPGFAFGNLPCYILFAVALALPVVMLVRNVWRRRYYHPPRGFAVGQQKDNDEPESP